MNKRKALETAQKYVQKGQYDKGLKEYLRHLESDPDDGNVRLKVGDLYLKLNDSESAIQAYTQVAQQFSRSGFDAKAVAIYRQILKVDAACLDARVKLGEHFQRMGLGAEALRELQEAVRICQERGLKRESFDLLKRVAELDPSNVPNRLSLADLLAREGLKDESREEFEKLLAEVERDGAADMIVRVAEQMLACFPDSEASLIAYCSAKVKVGLSEDAAERVSAALASFPESVALREALIGAYEAMGAAEKVASAWREIAELYKRRGDDERSREILQRYVPLTSFDEGGAEMEPPSLEDLRSGGLLDFSSDELGAGSMLEPRTPPRLGPRTPPKPIDEPDQDMVLGDEDELTFESDEPPSAPEIEVDGTYEDWVGRATVERDFGDPAKAREYAERALELDPNGEAAHEVLASLSGGDIDIDTDADDLHTLPDIELVLLDEEDESESDLSSVDPPTAVREQRRGRAAHAPAVEPPSPAIASDSDEFEIDIDDLDVSPPDAPSLDGRDEVEAPSGRMGSPPPAVAPPTPRGQPSSAVAKTIDAAERIYAKGLIDEARLLYEQVLESVPHHPQALARLGEIAAGRGEDPEESATALQISFADTHVDPESSGDLESSARGGAALPGAEDLEIDVDMDGFGADDSTESTEAARSLDVAPPASEIEIEDFASDDDALGVDLAAELADDDDVAPAAADTAARVSGEETGVDLAEGHAPGRGAERVAPTQTFDVSELMSLDDDSDDSSDGPEVAFDTDDAPEGADEDGFDLAAELEGAEDGGVREPAFADVLDAFKRGIEAQVSAADSAARYDLAIAYKEMGLIDDAVEALEIAQRAGGLGVEGIALLATCKLDLGRAAEAVTLLTGALEKSEGAVSGRERVALRYDLGLALRAADRTAEALAAFRQVAADDPGFREVQEQIAELSG